MRHLAKVYLSNKQYKSLLLVFEQMTIKGEPRDDIRRALLSVLPEKEYRCVYCGKVISPDDAAFYQGLWFHIWCLKAL